MQLTYYDHKAGQHLIMKRYKWALWGFIAGTVVGLIIGVSMAGSYY